MKLQRLLPFALSACCALFAGSAQAQSNDTYLYIVHAASGRQLSSTMNPDLPVDILVNDSFCIVRGAKFGSVAGPFTATAGTFDFKVSLASSGFPCTNPTIYEVPNVPLGAGITNFAVVGLNPSNQLMGYIFPADLSPIPVGQARVQIFNASDESLTAALSSSMTSNSLNYIAPGTSAEGLAPMGLYTGSILEATTNKELVGQIMAPLYPRDLHVYVLGGSGKNSAVTFIPKDINGVF